MTGGRPETWLRVAIVCAALPIVSATVLMVGFFGFERLTFSPLEPWVEAGVIVIWAGLLLFLVGVCALCVYVIRGLRRGVPGLGIARTAVMTLTLLLVNFPLALGCMMLTADSISRVRLRLRNESTTVLESLAITWSGGEERLGTLTPGQSVRLSFHSARDGAIRFTARQGGEDYEGELLGYVSSNMSLTNDVIFLGDGQVRVEEP